MPSDYNLYVTSDKNEYRVYLNNHITCKKGEQIRVTVKNFSIQNTMYNITSTNNTFTFEVRTYNYILLSSSQKTIPIGNYSVATFRDTIKGLLTENGVNLVNLVYNSQDNTYTYYNSSGTTNRYILKNIACPRQFGLLTDTEIDSINGTKSSYINMGKYNQIILKSNLNYMDLNQDNILSTGLRISQILMYVNRLDSAPFDTIVYDGDAFSYNLINSDIGDIQFNLVNEDNTPVSEQCGLWFLHLKFEVIEQNKVEALLADIKYLILTMIKYFLGI